jgi:hypothetical protein
MTPAHIYLSLGKPGDRDRLVEAMLQQQELQVSFIDLPILTHSIHAAAQVSGLID